jgi:hypothetical protein
MFYFFKLNHQVLFFSLPFGELEGLNHPPCVALIISILSLSFISCISHKVLGITVLFIATAIPFGVGILFASKTFARVFSFSSAKACSLI